MCLAVSLVSALLWARAKDPFSRLAFSFGRENGTNNVAKAILLRPLSPRPTVVYLPNAGNNANDSGRRLRQLAELGMAAVGFDYEPDDQSKFDVRFLDLLKHVRMQPWAQTNSAAWFGRGVGARRLLDFARHYPAYRPRLLILLTGTRLLERNETEKEAGAKNQLKPTAVGDGLTGCRVLLVYGQRETSLGEYEGLAQELRVQKAEVDIWAVDQHDSEMNEEENLVYRIIAEYCAWQMSHTADFRLAPEDSGHSVLGLGQTGGRLPESCPLWAWDKRSVTQYWFPAAGMFTLLIWQWWRRLKIRYLRAWSQLPRLVRSFRVFAWCIAALAVLQLGWRLALPRQPISKRVISLARTIMPTRLWQRDFDWLCADRNWLGKPLKALLEHIELANLQRTQFYVQLPDAMYREFILSPKISEADRDPWDWRRQFWEAFYSRIRTERNPFVAAQTVVRFLRERVEIVPGASVSTGVRRGWQCGATDKAGFEKTYVAALRSVGIATRLDSQARAELWTGEKWVLAPRPLIESISELRRL
jgi:hypothetical protein